MTDNCATNINIVGNDVYCVNEFGFQIQVDPHTLARTHKLDAFKTFGISFLTPHPTVVRNRLDYGEHKFLYCPRNANR